MLAIVIPYYKLTFFEDTLISLAHQTDKRFKVYIGNDASPEDPQFLLDKYKERFDFNYHRFEDNLGAISLVKQWDRCIALSGNEDWMMLLCDDDTLSENCIADFYKSLPEINENECNVVRFATRVKQMELRKISELYEHPVLEKATDFMYRRMTNSTRSSLSEYIFRKSMYLRYGFFDYRLAWHSDDRAWLEFSQFKYIYSINSASVCFRLSKENISRSDFRIEEKNQATLAFYHFVIFKHILKFKRLQRKELLHVYEQFIYKINKANFSFFICVFTLLFINLYFIQSIKFARRLLIHLNKHAQSS
ncbi:glycosyltransferase family A protein [Flavobacterium sp. 120]|uniref:glycosyltransferase family A protein n=1 Tax=Flavobacterium sp. 120 TaxID=2135626 RepID=UPI000EB54A1B|nr:glycosyltransferase family A protein [Flavobacterium sp. 120]RKS13350.1 glycosyl transferase family 2 [Flavobacterium sp. 120]